MGNHNRSACSLCCYCCWTDHLLAFLEWRLSGRNWRCGRL